MACFAVEYILLFMGVSLFTRSIVLLSMIAHLTGLILVALFVYHVSTASSTTQRACACLIFRTAAAATAELILVTVHALLLLLRSSGASAHTYPLW